MGNALVVGVIERIGKVLQEKITGKWTIVPMILIL
jgi:hypothetical protein